MEQPLVSIITITRNRASLIHRCIESIQKQTYQNYEHIIIDGASTDNTREVVESYNDPHIRFIGLKENIPLPDTWELALSMYKGEFFTSLDDDDEYLPAKIEKQVQLMQSLGDEYGMVYCWMNYYDNKSGELISTHASNLRGDGILADVIASPKVCGTPSLFMRRGVWEMCMEKAKNDAIGSDWLYGVRICQQYKVDFVPECLINVYVNHGHQRMSERGYYKDIYKKTIKFHQDFLEEFKEDFEKYPRSSELHYNNICRSQIMLGQYKDAFGSYEHLLHAHFSLRNLIYLPYVYIQKLIGKE